MPVTVEDGLEIRVYCIIKKLSHGVKRILTLSKIQIFLQGSGLIGIKKKRGLPFLFPKIPSSYCSKWLRR